MLSGFIKAATFRSGLKLRLALYDLNLVLKVVGDTLRMESLSAVYIGK